MKLSSKSKPRLVVYLSAEELKASKAKAKINGFKTPHQWLGNLMRRELTK